MIPVERSENIYRECLPKVRGRLDLDVPMAKYTWFKTGGTADVLFQPLDAEDLAEFPPLEDAFSALIPFNTFISGVVGPFSIATGTDFDPPGE